MFIWPTIIVHKIDQHSPLYTLSAQDMQINGFEIVVMLGLILIPMCPQTNQKTFLQKVSLNQQAEKHKPGVAIYHSKFCGVIVLST